MPKYPLDPIDYATDPLLGGVGGGGGRPLPSYKPVTNPALAPFEMQLIGIGGRLPPTGGYPLQLVDPVKLKPKPVEIEPLYLPLIIDYRNPRPETGTVPVNIPKPKPTPFGTNTQAQARPIVGPTPRAR